jgi:hypothetical protein
VEEDLDLLMRAIPEIDRGSVSYGRWGAVLKSPHLTTTTMMEGVHVDFSELRSMYHAAGGRFLNQRDVAERRRVDLPRRLHRRPPVPRGDAVGSTVHLDGLPFTVVGTMASKAQMSMNNGPDADRAIIPATTFRTIYGPRQVSHILVRPRDIREAEVVKRRLYEVLGARYAFDPDDTRALRMWDFIEEERITRAIGLGIQIFLGVVGALTLIVAGRGGGQHHVRRGAGADPGDRREAGRGRPPAPRHGPVHLRGGAHLPHRRPGRAAPGRGHRGRRGGPARRESRPCSSSPTLRCPGPSSWAPGGDPGRWTRWIGILAGVRPATGSRQDRGPRRPGARPAGPGGIAAAGSSRRPTTRPCTGCSDRTWARATARRRPPVVSNVRLSAVSEITRPTKVDPSCSRSS